MAKKYRIPVSIIATASTMIGIIECDSLEEYEDKAEKLWESEGFDAPSLTHDNKFDLGDWGIYKVEEADIDVFEVTKE